VPPIRLWKTAGIGEIDGALKSMIRLIALDLDQTLFGADLAIAPAVSEAVKSAQSRGVQITIATGREAKLAERFARELEISSPIIAAQGGCIYDHITGALLHDVRLEPNQVARIVEAADRYGWSYHFEAFDRLYFPAKSNHPPMLFELVRYSNWVRVGDLLRDMREAPNKLIVTVAKPEDREPTRRQMEQALGDEVNVISSHPHLLEALPHGVNKAHGLEWLAGHLGIERSAVMAIGDSEADVPMLKWAGVGVAMGNATSGAKAAAKWIAPSLEQHGVAAAIQKFCLQSAI